MTTTMTTTMTTIHRVAFLTCTQACRLRNCWTIFFDATLCQSRAGNELSLQEEIHVQVYTCCHYKKRYMYRCTRVVTTRRDTCTGVHVLSLQEEIHVQVYTCCHYKKRYMYRCTRVVTTRRDTCTGVHVLSLQEEIHVQVCIVCTAHYKWTLSVKYIYVRCTVDIIITVSHNACGAKQRVYHHILMLFVVENAVIQCTCILNT